MSWNQGFDKWQGQLCQGSAVHSLGRYGSEVQAAHLYNLQALHLKDIAAAATFPAADYVFQPSGTCIALSGSDLRFDTAGMVLGMMVHELMLLIR